MHSEVVVVAEKALVVPVAQDQFRSTVTVLAVAEVVVEVAVASKDHEITFEIRGCSFSEH